MTTPALSHASPPETPSPVEGLIRQLYGLGAVRRELSRAAHRELASQGFSALVAIRRRGACRVSDVACDLQIDLSVASRQIASVVAAGHVERRPDPADGRAHLLHLTPSGNAAIAGAHRGMVDVLEAALADWTPAEIETLSSGLSRLVQHFSPPLSEAQELSR